MQPPHSFQLDHHFGGGTNTAASGKKHGVIRQKKLFTTHHHPANHCSVPINYMQVHILCTADYFLLLLINVCLAIKSCKTLDFSIKNNCAVFCPLFSLQTHGCITQSRRLGSYFILTPIPFRYTHPPIQPFAHLNAILSSSSSTCLRYLDHVLTTLMLSYLFQNII